MSPHGITDKHKDNDNEREMQSAQW